MGGCEFIRDTNIGGGAIGQSDHGGSVHIRSILSGEFFPLCCPDLIKVVILLMSSVLLKCTTCFL